jgi:(p)ppGpp synthase/HD superfamily hydrolase
MRKSEELARRWMPGFRHGPSKRSAWEHPRDLVILLGELPGVRTALVTERLVDVAWMHDLLEDGRKEDGSRVTQLDLFQENFGYYVVTDVVALTAKDGEEKPTYLKRLAAASRFAKIVKCVDRICNLREGASVFKPARWERYVDETTSYLIPLAEGIGGEEGPWLKEKLVESLALRAA